MPVKGALSRVADALKRAQARKVPEQLPKRDVFAAYDISETDLLGGDEDTAALAQHMSSSPLGQLLLEQNIGVRVTPKGARPFSSRAHFDAVGGAQLPYLAPSGLWDELDPQVLRELRFLDMNAMPRNRATAYNDDPFLFEGQGSSLAGGSPVRSGLKPYGLYVNQVEGQVKEEDGKVRTLLELLGNPSLRQQLNISGYVPRSSELYRKPLLLAKKHGGAV